MGSISEIEGIQYVLIDKNFPSITERIKMSLKF